MYPEQRLVLLHRSVYSAVPILQYKKEKSGANITGAFPHSFMVKLSNSVLMFLTSAFLSLVACARSACESTGASASETVSDWLSSNAISEDAHDVNSSDDEMADSLEVYAL